MNLRQIIERSASIVGVEENLDFENPSMTLTRLNDCAKMIYGELTLEYIPLKRKEKVTLEGGRCAYTALSQNVREILSVKRGGVKLPHASYPTYLECEGCSGEVEVTYLFYPSEPSVDEELLLPPQFTLYFMALGTVSEYYYRVGMVDEALFYKTRYEHSLSNLTRNLKSVTIPRRRFIW